MTFEVQYEAFLKEAKKNLTGEALRRFDEGHFYAEKLFLQKVWWPAIGDFEFLHPEYEVEDFKDGRRYLDFAYIRQPYRVAIEIDVS